MQNQTYWRSYFCVLWLIPRTAMPFPFFNSYISFKIQLKHHPLQKLSLSPPPSPPALPNPKLNYLPLFCIIMAYCAKLYHYTYSTVLYFSIYVSSLLNVSSLKVDTGLTCFYRFRGYHSFQYMEGQNNHPQHSKDF